jgi:membrane-bound ClpP family serine protease
LSRVRDTAPTQAIDANTRPPQLGNDATDAQLAQNYKQKATYMRNLAKKYPDNPEYLENAAQYDQWAARREALANGTSNQ